jgi:hypothetical protein
MNLLGVILDLYFLSLFEIVTLFSFRMTIYVTWNSPFAFHSPQKIIGGGVCRFRVCLVANFEA